MNNVFFTKFSKFTRLELGPKKVSGDFFGLAPPFTESRALSMPLMSKGDPAPLARLAPPPSCCDGEAVDLARFAVRMSKSSTSRAGPAAPPGDPHGSLAEAAVLTGGWGLQGSAKEKRKKKIVSKNCATQLVVVSNELTAISKSLLRMKIVPR